MAGKHHKYKGPRFPGGRPPPYRNDQSFAARDTRSQQSAEDDATTVGDRPVAKKPRMMKSNRQPQQVSKLSNNASHKQSAYEQPRTQTNASTTGNDKESIPSIAVPPFPGTVSQIELGKKQAPPTPASTSVKCQGIVLSLTDSQFTAFKEFLATTTQQGSQQTELSRPHPLSNTVQPTEKVQPLTALQKRALQVISAHEDELSNLRLQLNQSAEALSEVGKQAVGYEEEISRLKKKIAALVSLKRDVTFDRDLYKAMVDLEDEERLPRIANGGSEVSSNNGSIAEDSSEIIHRSTSLNSTDQPSALAPIVDTDALTTSIGGDADKQENGNTGVDGSAETSPSGEGNKGRKRKRGSRGSKKKGKKERQGNSA